MNLDFSKNPLIVYTIVTIIGILFGKFFLPFDYAIWTSCTFFALFLISIFIIKTPIVNHLFILAALLFAVAARFSVVYNMPINHIAFLDFPNIESITGKVINTKFKLGNKNKYTISVTNAEINDTELETSGKILLSTQKIDQKYLYGDLLKIRCKLQEPKGQRNPGQFDYKNYLSDEDIYLITFINHSDSIDILERGTGNIFIQAIIEPVKNHIDKTIQSYLSFENGSILKALLLGEKQDIDDDILDQFKNVGVVHVLAISGLHVGFIIIFTLIFLSFFRLNYNIKIYTLLIILLIYIIIVNFKAPVIRASIMAGLYLLAKLSERKISLFNIIFSAAFLLLINDPRDLFNPGFQFSFVAVISIVYGYPRLNEMVPLKKKLSIKDTPSTILKYFLKFIWDPFLVSLAAVLGTLPLTLYYYGILPTYALFANILVIPLVGLIVILGIFLVLIALFSSLMVGSLGHLIDLLFDLLKQIIAFFHQLPYSHLYNSTPSIVIVLLMLVLVFMLFNIKSKSYQFSSLGILLIIVFFKIGQNSNSNYLEVTFLDVGQGDASFIKFPNGESMLIDGGDDSIDWDQGKNAVLPFLRFNDISKIKYVVASHPHNDHIGGLTEILNTLTVDTLIISSYKFVTKKYEEMIGICEKKAIPIRYVGKGNQLYPDSSCRVYILHPCEEFVKENDFSGEECNNSSIVMKIQYGENSILFTGDAERQAEESYTEYAQFLESEIIKIGHHGSRTSSAQNMLNYVKPLVSLISLAEKNKFRHPSPQTVRRLKDNNVRTFLTSVNGAVKFQISPNKIKLINWEKNSLKLF